MAAVECAALFPERCQAFILCDDTSDSAPLRAGSSYFEADCSSASYGWGAVTQGAAAVCFIQSSLTCYRYWGSQEVPGGPGPDSRFPL